MSKRTIILLAAAGVLFLTVAVIYWPFSPGESSPQELAERALNGKTVEERELAAIALSRAGKEAVGLMRNVFRESDAPEVRGAMAQGLGENRDTQSVSDLLTAMEDESSFVRGRSGVAVKEILGMDFRFRANAAEEERLRIVASYRKMWEAVKDKEEVLEAIRSSGRREASP